MKSKLASKTLWVNCLVVLAAGATALSAPEYVAAQPELAAAAVTILGFVNVILRLVTTKPLR